VRIVSFRHFPSRFTRTCVCFFSAGAVQSAAPPTVATTAVGGNGGGDGRISLQAPLSTLSMSASNARSVAVVPLNEPHTINPTDDEPQFEEPPPRSANSEAMNAYSDSLQCIVDSFVNQRAPLAAAASTAATALGTRDKTASRAPPAPARHQPTIPFSARPGTLLPDSSASRRDGRQSSHAFDDSAAPLAAPSDLPPGFPNIGNTCYMCVHGNQTHKVVIFLLDYHIADQQRHYCDCYSVFDTGNAVLLISSTTSAIIVTAILFFDSRNSVLQALLHSRLFSNHLHAQDLNAITRKMSAHDQTCYPLGFYRLVTILWMCILNCSTSCFDGCASFVFRNVPRKK
jgi:hypothetical protein